MTTTSSSTGSSASSSSAASLSFITATTPTSRAKVNESWIGVAQGPRPRRVVRGVDEHGGAAAHDLEPPRGVDGCQPGPHHVDVERLLATAEERLDRRDRHGRVLRLVGAVQRQEEIGVLRGQAAQRDLLPTDGHVARGDAEVVALEHDPGTHLGRALDEHLGRLGRLLQPDDGDGVGLDDAGLLPRDLLDGVAEEVPVVEVDRRDDRDRGVDDVRRVPRAAHADLDDRDVDRQVGERGVRDGHEHLEVGHRRAAVDDRAGVDHLDERDHLVVGAEEALRVDRAPTDGDPLEHRVQVRRGEPTGVQAELAQQRLDDPGRARLAVGSGDVDDREGALRVAEQLHDGADPVERGLEVVLGGAGEDRRLHLTHPSVQLEQVRGIALGGIGGRAHPPIVHADPRRPARGASGPPRHNTWLWVA